MRCSTNNRQHTCAVLSIYLRSVSRQSPFLSSSNNSRCSPTWNLADTWLLSPSREQPPWPLNSILEFLRAVMLCHTPPVAVYMTIEPNILHWGCKNVHLPFERPLLATHVARKSLIKETHLVTDEPDMKLIVLLPAALVEGPDFTKVKAKTANKCY